MTKKTKASISESIDKVVMNRFLAFPIFLFVLWAIFQLTFFLGKYPVSLLEKFFSFLGNTVSSMLPNELLQSLFVGSVIGGVGGVISFAPNIVILFFLLSVLEDIGYFPRTVAASDKLLHVFGLHGQSLFPMMLGFGCSVPAIIAARTLTSRRDRIITILIIPFMSCGAKLPVLVLLASAFFADNAANMVMLIYVLGIVIALLAAFVLNKTLLKGELTSYEMTIPPYRAPSMKKALLNMGENTWHYIKKAGTVVLASSILIWLVTYFPANKMSDEKIDELRTSFAVEYFDEDVQFIDQRIESSLNEERLVNSYAGRFGRFIEPIFKPLGFNWKIAIASIIGLGGKEMMVSTLGILYKAAPENNEAGSLRDAVAQDPAMTPLIAFCLMLFVLIIPPCFAALSAIKTEIGWKWLGFEIASLLILGWLMCFMIYQIGGLLSILW
ncbi:MAG: ferrous iron transport protein B [Treponema sp.]|nr:ferrous iron transport protein B [Treponema sp.]